ncbi:hypothetical protein E2C01_098755 [Portunus trituberculatus]|uniref:Secreted protein n=1 Tax=Portunus trituberculatus TaxID=210409 RepID=A0A5B7JYK8_PORTR|nr:hypothetical protein [Portunus trituberculatus]
MRDGMRVGYACWFLSCLGFRWLAEESSETGRGRKSNFAPAREHIEAREEQTGSNRFDRWEKIWYEGSCVME